MCVRAGQNVGGGNFSEITQAAQANCFELRGHLLQFENLVKLLLLGRREFRGQLRDLPQELSAIALRCHPRHLEGESSGVARLSNPALQRQQGGCNGEDEDGDDDGDGSEEEGSNIKKRRVVRSAWATFLSASSLRGCTGYP